MRTSTALAVRNSKDVPFYCHPLRLFFAVWLLMLVVLRLHVSYTTYPEMSLPLLLFGISAISFLAGYATLRSAYSAVGFCPKKYSGYRIDVKALRRFHFCMVLLTAGIMAMNLKRFGPPPVLGFFGVETLDYQEYGALLQPAFTALLAIFVSAPLEPSAWRRWALYVYAPASLLIYVSRGFLLIMLLQALVVFSLRTRLSKAKIYLVALTTLGAAVLLSDMIGNSRNSLGSKALLGFLQIRHSYYDWPSAYLWVIAYISTPFSNLCWIIRVYQYQHPTFSFLYSALPGFWSQKTLEATSLGSENIVDGVHTYIAKYYLDFWFFGIIGINYVWGVIAAYISAGNRLTRNYLASSVILSCIAFMFFSDFLTILIILMELFAVTLLQRRISTGEA